MPGNSGNKSNKPKLHGSTSSLRDTFNQALNEATTAEQARSKANSGEGRPAKNLEQQLADAGVKTGQNIPWYKDVWGRQLHAQEAVKNKNFDAFKEFSDEQIRQMYPDDAQLANYIINGKNDTFMRDSKSLNEDAIAYEKKYGKVSDADVDSIIDAAIQKRDKKSLEDMGILTNDAIERWIDRHPSNSGFGKTGNILKSWRDEPAKYVIESEVTDANNASRPAETKTNQPAANLEKQAAQDMVNFTLVGDPYGNPNFKLKGKPYAPAPALYERPPAKETGFEPRTDLDTINLVTGRGSYSMSPARYNSLSSILGRNEPMLMGLTAAGVLGLGGLGLYGRYKYGDIEQPQTQVPYQMEPEPVNEAVAQSELTPEQQFVLQSTSPFDYAKGANLFDLYDRYGSPIASDNSVNDEELIDETADESVLPQNPPVIGTNIKDADFVIPDADEAPEEINDAMLDAKVASKVDVAKNAFGRALALSKTAPKASNGSASNIQDTSNGPAVLNAPRQRKTNGKVNYQDTAKQILGASEAVNNLAREAYNFNKYQNSQKPEAALAQSLLRAQQESRANRGDTGLQQYRYQSLLNSGLRGMTPDEAIRSGLLTPEQVQVLMRGPY